MTRAVTAPHSVGVDRAIVSNPDGVTNLNGGLLLYGDVLNGSGGTNVCTASASGEAIALVELHLRLKQRFRV